MSALWMCIGLGVVVEVQLVVLASCRGRVDGQDGDGEGACGGDGDDACD